MLINFDNNILKSEEILARISEKEIYEYYLQQSIKEGKLYLCPFHGIEFSVSLHVHIVGTVGWDDFKSTAGSYVR